MAVPFSLGDYVYAHRGLWASDGPPENSLLAFDAAMKAEIGMEIDIRLSADGIPICFHDRVLDRMTSTSGLLADHTASALDQIELEHSGQTIPTLQNMLQRWPHHLPLLVEIKASDIPPEPVAEATATLLTNYPGRAAAMSFNPVAVATLPKSLPRGLLIEKIHKSSEADFDASLQTALDLQVDYLSVWREDVSRAAPFARAHGLGSVTWTIQTVEQSAQVAPFVDAQIIEGFAPDLTARR